MAQVRALTIENLCFSFNGEEDSSLFFKNFSCSFFDRHLHFLQGKNGSGKSTLFRILRGIKYEDEFLTGVFTLHGEKYSVVDDESYLPHEFVNNIRMVPQNFDLMIANNFNFKQNLRLANLSEFPLFAPLAQHKPIPELVKRFEIDEEKPARLLSGGQRQILAILMALQKRVSILLLDEPTAALDEKNAQMVMTFLQGLLKTVDITVIVICHDKDIVLEYATDYYFELQVEEKTRMRAIHKHLI